MRRIARPDHHHDVEDLRREASQLSRVASWWIAVILALGLGLTGCGSNTTPPDHSTGVFRPPTTDRGIAPPRPRFEGPYPGPAVASIEREPRLRVRVAAAEPMLILGQSSAIRIASPSGELAYDYAAPVRVTWRDGGFVIRDAAGHGVAWQLPSLIIDAPADAATVLGERSYPGRLVLMPSLDRPGLLDAVNHVPLETYLPGVLERELYASWHAEAYRAQAIAARSYALWEMTIARHRPFDLEATEASQVYGGQATNPKALAAVRDTRGQVLAYNGKVLPAFFASSSGGLGQDALIAFPNRVEDLPPLHAREHGAWDRDSPTYRWGPITRPTPSLSQRIAAWGRANGHPVTHLGTLTGVQIADTNRVGRPAAYRLTDNRGKSYTLGCESFRNACNAAAPGLPAPPRDQRLLSSHVEVTVSPTQTTFRNGRGHGHGVGLSQWGAQAMAQAGHRHRAILGFYYPGADVQQAY